MKLKDKINGARESAKSVRVKLFFTICIIITLIIVLLVIINSVVLEKFYLYNNTKNVINIYNQINNYYEKNESHENIQEKLQNFSINNNLDILIKTDQNIMILTTYKYNIDSSKEI